MELNEIQNGVLKCLGESLAKSVSDIAVTATLIADLGVDSLDILDISFSLEKEFKIKLRGSALDELLKMDFKTDVNGFLNLSDIKRFAAWMPALAKNNSQNIKPVELFNFITVESLALLIQQQLKMHKDQHNGI